MSEQDSLSKWRAMGIRTDTPQPARVYDYWLGGKDNFAIDRETAERGLELIPEFLDYAQGNRQFLARAVRFLSGSGIRQYLDIGAGLPTSPNVHEIAQADDPDSRVVYVDNDPIVFLHAENLMATKNAKTTVVRADMHDTADVLAEAGKLIDFSQPVALLFVASLHHIEDDDDAAGIVSRYLDALVPGSYLVLSHFTHEYAVDRVTQAAAEAKERRTPLFPRGKDTIEGLFRGLPLLDPGLVLVPYWRPDPGGPGPNADRCWAYGGVAEVARPMAEPAILSGTRPPQYLPGGRPPVPPD